MSIGGGHVGLRPCHEMVIDHVAMLVPDATRTAKELRREYGLGSEQGAYLPLAGTRGYNVPLTPPAHLEFHAIEDRERAEATEAGRIVLACEAVGFGLFSWSVLVDDLEAVADRLSIDIFDYTIPHGDGTLRGWRAVSGPPHMPFFIDYPNNGDRIGRWRAMYDRVGHSSAPTDFLELTVGGSESEMRDWLGPHDLPLRFVGGRQGIREARIGTADGEVVIA
jgi:hypothetical protein